VKDVDKTPEAFEDEDEDEDDGGEMEMERTMQRARK
jgi:hypothetical protein